MAHNPLSDVAAYPEYAQESTGGARFPVYPVINEATSAHSLTSTGHGPLRLGQPVIDRYGFRFMYCRAQAGLVVGQVVTLAANPTEGAVQTADSTADNIHVIKTNLASLVANAEVGNFIHFGNTTGSVGDLKLILANTATVSSVAYITISKINEFMGRGDQYDGNAPAAAYATSGSEVSLIRPYQVGVAGANALAFGVAMGTVTSGNNTLVQTVGLASAKGKAADAFTDNGRVYTAATGEVSITAGDEEALVGLSKSAYAGANSVTVPVWLVNVQGKW
jgi:hypothetical protein